MTDSDKNPLQPSTLTPMERQYHEIKSRHKDKILLFRLGDFYEMFYEDAREAAEILHIALTSRKDMPMCGFPYHAATQYIQKLIAAGKKVAVCEQMENPALAKGLVKRDIVSIITPGTLLDDQYIKDPQNNFLCALYASKGEMGICFVDISTEDFYGVYSVQMPDFLRVFQDELGRFSPSELIYNDGLKEGYPLIFEQIQKSGILSDAFPEWYFDPDFLSRFLKSTEESNLFSSLAKGRFLTKSISAALRYLGETQRDSGAFTEKIPSLLARFQTLSNAIVEIDDFTMRNLELAKNMQDGSKKFTLLEVLDGTVTPMGGRLLRRWLLMPLTDIQALYERQNNVEAFFEDALLTAQIREVLRKMGDLERLAARISLKKAIPRDLPALSRSLRASLELKNLLLAKSAFGRLAGQIDDLSFVSDLIDRAILPEPSSTFGGEVVQTSFSQELDSLRKLRKDGKDWILELQNRERERTRITSLKIRYNNIFGYFIEISKANLSSVPADYIKKQTLVNAERFTIPELSEYEAKIASADERIGKLEQEIFEHIQDETAKSVSLIQKTAYAAALADVYSNLAVKAKENRYAKPSLDESGDFHVVEGRHPVVEKFMGQNLFVPNDAHLDEDENRILIITGPNMAGKSTYLRQNALIAVMAQMGSYIPAREAKIGIVDKIFTRIGASDNLSQGRSTFLVEMQEAANILKNSTEKSLIIMDELGRGTSTYDGLSIAWAVLEYLQKNKARGGKTLFATHYHELTELGEKKGIKNLSVAVREYQDELVFLRKVIPGSADRSYGIYVAKLAGLPSEIIERAKIILKALETEGSAAKSRIEDSPQFDLFPDNIYKSWIDRIKNLDLNRMTPLEAITFLSEIQKKL
jgi:DNA mismatch repair protein MutS